MESTTFADLAVMVAVFGALGVVVAVLNIVALRVVRIDDVPSFMRARIRWWGVHNPAFFLISVAIAVAGLAAFAAA